MQHAASSHSFGVSTDMAMPSVSELKTGLMDTFKAASVLLAASFAAPQQVALGQPPV